MSKHSCLLPPPQEESPPPSSPLSVNKCILISPFLFHIQLILSKLTHTHLHELSLLLYTFTVWLSHPCLLPTPVLIYTLLSTFPLIFFNFSSLLNFPPSPPHSIQYYLLPLPLTPTPLSRQASDNYKAEVLVLWEDGRER